VIETNLNSMFNVTKQVVADMVEKGWGRIINISSVNGEKGQAGQTNYSAAKAGMHGFSMALAQELATKGVTVNTVSPGYIGTDMVKAIREDVLAKIVATVPVKRLGEPSEIASIIAWLASRRRRLRHRRRLLGQRRLAHGLPPALQRRRAPRGPAAGRQRAGRPGALRTAGRAVGL
jgi:NAD(P)-dependent dehydrogenase (short-subunit alcohol dehydrogenase family)